MRRYTKTPTGKFTDAKAVKKTPVENLRDTRPIGPGADACFRSMTGLGNESAPSDTVQTAGRVVGILRKTP